jgi:hypothetical protein
MYEETSPDEVYLYSGYYVKGKQPRSTQILYLEKDLTKSEAGFAFCYSFSKISDPELENKVRNLLGLPIKESNFFAI